MQANQRANSASNDTQSITNANDEIKGDANTDGIIGTENTNNAAIDADNIDNAATDGEKTDDATMSDNNQTMLQQVMVIPIIQQQVILVLYMYFYLHVTVEKPKIQARLKAPQNVHLLLQDLQQVTPFQMIMLL